MNTIQSEIISTSISDSGNNARIEHTFTQKEISNHILDRFTQSNSYRLNKENISQTPTKKKRREVVTWVVFILLISFFTFFQFQIYQYSSAWIGKIFLSISVIVEFYLIWIINNYFG
jgi:hypothetical protein